MKVSESILSLRKLYLPWPAVLVLAFILGIQFLDGTLSNIRGGDGASYVLLAKALAAGHGYSDINIPGAPPHTQYPPVLPIILSPLVYLFGFNFLCMKLVIVAFGVATVYMVKVIFEEETDRATGVTLAILVSTNFYFLFFEGELMTEIPYAFFSLLAFHCFRKYSKDDKLGPYSIILPAVVAVAYMTRMIGVTMYAAMVTVLLINAFGAGAGRRPAVKKLVFFGAAGIVPFVLWTIRNSLISRGVSTYQSIFMQSDYYSLDSGILTIGSFADRAVTNLSYYMYALPKSVITSSIIKDLAPAFLLNALMLLVLAVVLIGFINEFWRKRGGKEFFFLFYLALLTVWPVYGSGDARRYVVPVLPFIYYYFLCGINVIGGLGKAVFRSGAPEFKRAGVLACLLLLLINLVEIRGLLHPVKAAGRAYAVAGGLHAGFSERNAEVSSEALGVGIFAESTPCYSSYILAADYLRSVISLDDVVMTRKPEVVALVTGGYAVRFPYTNDPDVMSGFMDGNSIDYVLLDACYMEARKYLVPYLNERMEMFEILADDSRGTVVLRYTQR